MTRAMTTRATIATRPSPATIALAVGAAVALQAAPAGAYETKHSEKNGATLRWFKLPIKFNIHLTAAPGVSAAGTQTAVRAAYKTWSRVTCSTFDALDQGVVNVPYGSRVDGLSTNTWVPVWPEKYPVNALAMTLTEYNLDTGEITDSDTQYNPNRKWSTTGDPLALDIQAVATHEIGHQLGLGHSAVPEATMYYAMGTGHTAPRSLHSDDIAGVCHLYPSGQPVPDECTVTDDCAPSETCNLGKCVQADGVKKGYGGPCIQALDCLSEYCFKTAEGDMLCSQLCASEPCPNGDDCVTGKTPSGQQLKICRPNTANLAQPIGTPCLTPLQCASQLCISVSGHGDICSQRCDVDADDCPAGYVCTPGSLGGLCVPEPDAPADPPPPPAPPNKSLGEGCSADAECVSGLCAPGGAGNVCVQPCQPGPQAVCPEGFDCLALDRGTSGEAAGGCFPTSQVPPRDPPASCADVGCPDGLTCVAAGDAHRCEASGGRSGGCALTAAAADRSPHAATWPLLALIALLRASTRRSRRPPPRS